METHGTYKSADGVTKVAYTPREAVQLEYDGWKLQPEDNPAPTPAEPAPAAPESPPAPVAPAAEDEPPDDTTPPPAA